MNAERSIIKQPIRKRIEPGFEITSGVNVEAAKSCYAQTERSDLCNCAYCQNYIDNIRDAPPKFQHICLLWALILKKHWRFAYADRCQFKTFGR